MANSARKLLIQSFGTDGEVITWDASANFATVSTGTSGHVLTSNGAGAAPTFQAASGAMVFIASSTASSSATIDFTSGIGSTYDEYIFVIVDLLPATNATSLWARFSDDGGSTWEAGATDYLYASLAYDSDGSPTDVNNDAGQAQMVISTPLSNTAGNTHNGKVMLSSPSNTTYDKNLVYRMGGVDSSGNSSGLIGASRLNQGGGTWAAIDGVRFLMSSGNIASGDFYLYGIKKS